jgi:hypothetical protein
MWKLLEGWSDKIKGFSITVSGGYAVYTFLCVLYITLYAALSLINELVKIFYSK